MYDRTGVVELSDADELLKTAKIVRTIINVFQGGEDPCFPILI